jgi:N-acetylmuramoyl-L-alanine amidase
LQPVAGSKGVIVLDPGHGRGDPGAVHYFEGGYYAEADSNLRNAELVRDRLVAMGYEVYLTRDGEGVGPGRPLPRQFIVSDLYSRVQLAKSVGAELFVAFHGNGASVKSIFARSRSTRATITRTRPASWNTRPLRSPIIAWRTWSKWK